MSMTLLVHVVAGSLALVTGYMALYSAKGAWLHRMAGMAFVVTMVTMFFIGQASVFPTAIRIPGPLALPVLAVLVTMLYWLWRVRIRRSISGTAGALAHRTR